MSVRKVLENFLKHVKKLETAEEEGGKENFSREFQVNVLKCQNQLSVSVQGIYYLQCS